MLTRLDDILYPNKVEVFDFSEIGKFFYPIYKCGNSTLRKVVEVKGFKTLVNNQIQQLTNVDTFIRDPRERYRSAVQTYMYWINRQHPELDFNTVYHYMRQGISLDRHLIGQLNWIINLSRYLNPDAKIHLHSMGMLSEYTNNTNIEALKLDTLDDQLLDDLANNANLDFQFRLDQIILDELVGDSWTIKQIMDHLKSRDLTAYTSIIEKAQHVLSKI
jgi:hypothetical protein